MAKATHAHCTSIYKARNVAFDPTAFNVDTILNNIQYSFCDSKRLDFKFNSFNTV